MQTEFIYFLERFDVISFDIFDTLLLRPYLKPADLFCKVAGERFARERVEAEREARKHAQERGREEISYDEIYAKLPQWSDVKTHELEEERSCLTANPEIVEVYKAAKAAGKKVVITSDMYLPRAVLEDALRGQGIDGWDAFYLSCDCGVQKASGKLFERLIEDLHVTPDKVMHIGDNEWSDYKVPSKLGIVAFHYVSIHERFIDANPFLKDFSRKPQRRASKSFMSAVVANGWNVYSHNRKVTYWNKFGYWFAGLVDFTFISWVIDVARSRNIKQLLFVARDGYIWEKACNILAPEIKTAYVYASRDVAHLAGVAVNENDVPEGDRIQRRKRMLKLVSEIRGLEIPEKEYQHYIENGRFLSADLDDRLSNILNNTKDEYRTYLRSVVDRTSDFALVDGVSTSRTIQRLVSELLEKPVFTFYYETNQNEANCASLYSAHYANFSMVGFWEFIFSAPHPSVKWICGDKPLYDRVDNCFESYKLSIYNEIVEGAMACVKWLSDRSATIDEGDLLDWCNAFCSNLTCEDREHLEFARHSIDSSHAVFGKIVPSENETGRRFRLFHVVLAYVRHVRCGLERRSFLVPRWGGARGFALRRET